MAEYQVTYVKRGSTEQKTATVKVDKVSGPTGQTLYYATNLTLWGCGKNASTPEGAIYLLVQDMATIINITQ